MPTPLRPCEGTFSCADVAKEILDWFAEDLAALQIQIELLANATDLTTEIHAVALDVHEAATRTHHLAWKLLAITTTNDLLSSNLEKRSWSPVNLLIPHDEINRAISSLSDFTTHDVLTKLGQPITRANEMYLAAALKEMGYFKIRISRNGRRHWAWYPRSQPQAA